MGAERAALARVSRPPSAAAYRRARPTRPGAGIGPEELHHDRRRERGVLGPAGEATATLAHTATAAISGHRERRSQRWRTGRAEAFARPARARAGIQEGAQGPRDQQYRVERNRVDERSDRGARHEAMSSTLPRTTLLREGPRETRQHSGTCLEKWVQDSCVRSSYSLRTGMAARLAQATLISIEY